MICADVCSPLKVHSKSLAKRFFSNDSPGVKSWGQEPFRHLFYSSFLTPVDVACEAAEAFELIQVFPVEVILIWARVFLMEAQNGCQG